MQTPNGGYPRDPLSPHLYEIVIPGQGACGAGNRMLRIRGDGWPTALGPRGLHPRVTPRRDGGKDKRKPTHADDVAAFGRAAMEYHTRIQRHAEDSCFGIVPGSPAPARTEPNRTYFCCLLLATGIGCCRG